MQDELIRLAAGGDQEAFHRLFELWFAKAYRIGKSVCGSRSLAEDAVQEAAIRFWRALRARKGGAVNEAYFMRIVANEARRIRARRNALPERYPERLPDASAAPEQSRAGDERLAELTSAVGRLPEKMREAIQLRYIGGFTEAETAELLGISLSGVKMRLLRGRQKLKAMLEDGGNEMMGGDRYEIIDR